jgi:two-component system OmpR family sensor kinase
MSESAATPPRRWYRSLYWRIAAGFIAFLAAMLLVQVGFFVWLASQRDEALPPRMLANLAALVADELAADIAQTPTIDLATAARDRLKDLDRPAVVVLADGQIVGDGPRPPEPQVRAAVRQMSRPGLPGPWGAPRRPGGFGRPGGGRPLFDGADGRGRPRPMGSPPWAAAPVPVAGRAMAVVFVARDRPLTAIVRELAPWLAAGLVALLAAGTALAAVAIFRPAHARLSDLENAVRRFGDGDRSARASTTGGDEVSAVAGAFNRMADEAAAREAALVEVDRARRQLLADVSHELRTPLTSIRGYAETLTLGGFAPATPQGQHAVHVIGVEAQRLARIVNDLLDLAQLEAGGAAFDAVPVRVPDLFTRVLERHGPAAATARIALATEIEVGAEAVMGDGVRLEQVVQNLTANALRHVGSGGHVALRARRDGEAVVITVADDGEGIAAEHVPHVFDRFYKADPSRGGGTGTGLGLSIVKAIVERHGGSVQVQSTPGVATTFEVRLPGAR